MKIVILLTFSLLLFSCGKKDQRSTVKLRISSSGLVNGNPMNGGLIVMGKSRTTPQSFSLDGHADMQVELDKGAWDFYVIGWLGNPAFVNKSFTGQIRCAYKAKVLEASEEEIGFNLSSSNCLNKIPPPNDFYPNEPSLSPSNNVPELHISSCINTSVVPTTYDNSCDVPDANTGLGRSYKIETYYSIGDSDGPQQPAGSEVSKCFNPDTNTTMRIPLGDTLKNDGIGSWKVYSYTEANCQGDFILYRFDEGLANDPDHPEQSSTFRIVGDDVILLLEHNPQTVSDNGQQLDFFWGTGADGTVTAPNLDLISPQYANDYYRIKSFSGDGKTIETVLSPLEINPGDEIIWYVSESAGGGCDNGPSGDVLKSGNYGWARVISKTSTTVTIDKPFNERQDNPNDWKIPSNGNLQVDMSFFPTTFCSMQIIRVPNYLNFHHNTITNTGPLEYDRANGIGGIFIIKVKDTFSMDTTAASRNLRGYGKGRLNIATPNYNHCNNTDSKCIKMGGSIDTIASGGGGIVIYAKNASFEKGSNNLVIRANGGTETAPGHTNGQRHAGSVLLRVENFEFIDNFNFGNSISANGSYGGDPGIVRFEYCNVIGAGSLPTTNPAIGSTGGYAVDDDPPYCP